MVFGFVLRNVCVALIGFLQLAMFARAIISWIPMDEDNKLEAFLMAITEPIIYPIRLIFDKFDSMRSMPLDIPFFITFLLLSVISTLLSGNG